MYSNTLMGTAFLLLF